ncbi:MAG: ferrous iron transport protein B [Thermoplasmata archaeon]|nr:ferrous iron transport protein B [Thermoplasmata archaeon]
MNRLKILLIGQPNVGKSSLLDAIVGPRAVISNYPGTTVEILKAEKLVDDTAIEFVDTPGIYSISDKSEEEKVTEKNLFETKIDGVVVVADATSLERSLYIVLQILEAKIPTIIALNFVEEAKNKGIYIDYRKLESFLNIPVIPINPLVKKGIENLIDKILDIKNQRNDFFVVRYDDHIEKAIERLSEHIGGDLPERFIALRVLEGDSDFYKYVEDEKIIDSIKDSIKEHPEVAEDICITRYGTSSFIAEKVTTIKPIKDGRDIEDRVDSILLHHFLGPISTTLSLVAVFGVLLYLGNIIQGYLMDLSDSFLASMNLGQNTLMFTLLSDGIRGLTAGVAIALPYVFLFYILLGLLEDMGVLSRFIINAERALRRIGLPGKAFIPLALGLGCTAAATRSTRVLSSKKEQFYTASFFSFVPCSSRTAIIMGVVGFYGGLTLAVIVFITMIISGVIWGLLINKILVVKREPLLLELPPYRMPLVRNILAKSWIRMKDFVYIVIPLLIVGGMLYGLMDKFELTGMIVNPLSQITKWLGLPSVIIIPILFGFLQKDLTGGMLVSVVGNNVSMVLTPLQLYTFGVATSIGIPCIIALSMLIKEFGFKKAIGLTIISSMYGILFAGISWRVATIFGF